MRTEMQKRCERIAKHNYQAARRDWRKKGKFVCPHGVFFDVLAIVDCPCLRPAGAADWRNALLMPALNLDLKCIVTDSFDQHTFQRIGVLKSQARRLNW
jgi:hypothetical protein